MYPGLTEYLAEHSVIATSIERRAIATDAPDFVSQIEGTSYVTDRVDCSCGDVNLLALSPFGTTGCREL